MQGLSLEFDENARDSTKIPMKIHRMPLEFDESARDYNEIRWNSMEMHGTPLKRNQKLRSDLTRRGRVASRRSQDGRGWIVCVKIATKRLKKLWTLIVSVFVLYRVHGA